MLPRMLLPLPLPLPLPQEKMSKTMLGGDSTMPCLEKLLSKAVVAGSINSTRSNVVILVLVLIVLIAVLWHQY